MQGGRPWSGRITSTGYFWGCMQPQGGEWNLSSRSHVRSAAGVAGPGAHAASGGSTSRPRVPGSHPGHQKVLCRGGSFTCFSSRHHGLGVCAAGRLWPAIIRQLSGPLPRAGERTGDFPAPAGRAGGLRVKGPFEAAPSSQAPGACLQAAKGVPTPRRHWFHV